MDCSSREVGVDKYIKRHCWERTQRCHRCQRLFDTDADLHCHTPCTSTMTLWNTLMHQCDRCNSRFPLIDQLVGHYDNQHSTHVYECLIQDCHKWDNDLDYMKRHVQQVHMDRYKICPIGRCFKQFTSRDQMQDHLMRDHSAGTARPGHRDSLSGSTSSSDRNSSRDHRSKSSSRQPVGHPGQNTASTSGSAGSCVSAATRPDTQRRTSAAGSSSESVIEKASAATTAAPAGSNGDNALSPTNRAALMRQRGPSATESQTGTAAITGRAAANAPAAARSEAESGKTVSGITSESHNCQPDPLHQTPPNAGPSEASSSQMHAEPAPGPVYAPAKRSAAAIPASATPKRRNIFALVPAKRQRVDSDYKENAEPDASSAIPPDVDSGHGKEVDEDDGVPFLEVNFRPALCPGCQKTFRSPWQMATHSCVSSAHGEVRCPFCPDKHLTNKDGVSRHLASQHFNHRFLCKECNATNAYKSIFLKHYATRHKDMHQCAVRGCPLIFKKAINLTRHLLTHAKNGGENFAPSSCSTPLAKLSASTYVPDGRPASMSSAPSAAKKDIAANSTTSDITLTSYAYVSTLPPVSSGAASCDANRCQEENDCVDMGDGMSLLFSSDSLDPPSMSFAEDDDKEKGIMLSEIKEQFARTLEPLDLSITSQVTLLPEESSATPAAAIEACVSEPRAGSLTANEPKEVEKVNNQFSAEFPEPPVSSYQPDQSVTSSPSAISYSHPTSPESEPVSPHGISECVPNESPAVDKKTMLVPVGRPSLSKHSLSCLPDPVWRCDACGVMLFSESGHTCSADLMQLLTHNESNEVGVTLEDGFLCITLD